MSSFQSQKVHFSSEHIHLYGVVELPEDKPVKAMLVFVHCLTCGKGSLAAVRVSRALAAVGYGVLRFDLRGLGESEGAFADSSLSTMVQDVQAACGFLAAQYAPPIAIIGHSMGGTAALIAAQQIPSVQSVITYGTPGSTTHVLRYINSAQQAELELYGAATVLFAGRPFLLREQFVSDAKAHEERQSLAQPESKPALVLHSLQDDIVLPEQAQLLYAQMAAGSELQMLAGFGHMLANKAEVEQLLPILVRWIENYHRPPA